MLSRFIPVFLCFLPSKANGEWHKTLSKQESSTHIYSVGFYESPELQVALDKAWEASIANVIKTNLPEALSIKEESVEALSGSNYDRVFSMKVGAKVLAGMSEASGEGSPKVFPSMRDGKPTFKVFRLLKWEKESIGASKDALNSTLMNKISTSKVESYKQMREWIKTLECGVTLEDVKEMLNDFSLSSRDGMTFLGIHQMLFEFNSDDNYLIRIETRMGTLIKRVCP